MRGTLFLLQYFGRLSRENNEVLDKTLIYSYNGIGNITSVKTYAYTTAATPSGTPTTTSFGYSVDKLTSFGINSISYDSMGCPTSVGNKKYVWDKGKLVRFYDDVDENDSVSSEDIRFTYNAYGQRISKTYSYDPGENYDGDFLVSSTTTYTYDNSGRLIREYCTESYYESDDQTREFIYLYDDSGITGVMYSKNGSAASLYYYDRNHRGDVIAIYDSNGNRKSGYAYDAYGNCTVTYSGDWDLTQRNPIRYRGYYYDRETGLYYLNARYYNPQWRRFISPDSPDYLDPKSVNGLNLYAYCNNDPVNYADPSGHLPEWAAWLISGAVIVGGIVLCATGFGSFWGGVLIGAGAGSLINGYVTEVNGGDFTAGYFGGAISGALCGIGAGLGGMAFAAASKVANLACIGYMTLGATISFAGGFAGNLAGTVYTSWHSSDFKSVYINWGETLTTSAIMGSLNIFAGMGSAMSSLAGSMGRVAIDVNSKFALRFLAGLIAGGTEATYDLTSYLIGKLISSF